MSLENPTIQEEIEYDAVRALGPEAVSRFIEMLARGETIRMACMLITQSPPRLGMTDTKFHATRRGNWYDNLTPIVAKAWNDEYKRRTGENIPGDAMILHGLAKGVGDHEVVLTHKHGLSDLKRVVEKRNVTTYGDAFNYEAIPEPPKPQLTRLAPDLVEGLRREYISEDPSLAHADQNELREMIVEKHGAPEVKDVPKRSGKTAFADLSREVWNERRRITIRTTPEGGGGTGAKSGGSGAGRKRKPG